MQPTKSLYETLGGRYVREFFVSALFRREDMVYLLEDATDNGLHVRKLDLNHPTARQPREILPLDTLRSFSDFKYPKLGYRQIQAEGVGNVVNHISSMRSVHRGFREENLNYKSLPVYDILYDDNWFFNQDRTKRIVELFKPTFYRFSEGMNKLTSGEWAGFAVNEDLAIGISCNTNMNRGWDIYFRDKVVGNITKDGKMDLTNKILQRSSIRNKLFA